MSIITSSFRRFREDPQEAFLIPTKVVLQSGRVRAWTACESFGRLGRGSEDAFPALQSYYKLVELRLGQLLLPRGSSILRRIPSKLHVPVLRRRHAANTESIVDSSRNSEHAPVRFWRGAAVPAGLTHALNHIQFGRGRRCRPDTSQLSSTRPSKHPYIRFFTNSIRPALRHPISHTSHHATFDTSRQPFITSIHHHPHAILLLWYTNIDTTVHTMICTK